MQTIAPLILHNCVYFSYSSYNWLLILLSKHSFNLCSFQEHCLCVIFWKTINLIVIHHMKESTKLILNFFRIVLLYFHAAVYLVLHNFFYMSPKFKEYNRNVGHYTINVQLQSSSVLWMSFCVSLNIKTKAFSVYHHKAKFTFPPS